MEINEGSEGRGERTQATEIQTKYYGHVSISHSATYHHAQPHMSPGYFMTRCNISERPILV